MHKLFDKIIFIDHWVEIIKLDSKFNACTRALLKIFRKSNSSKLSIFLGYETAIHFIPVNRNPRNRVRVGELDKGLCLSERLYKKGTRFTWFPACQFTKDNWKFNWIRIGRNSFFLIINRFWSFSPWDINEIVFFCLLFFKNFYGSY